MRIAGGFLLLPVLVALPSLAGELTGRARVQVGQEYDTNAAREYSSMEPEADALARVVLEGDVRYDTGDNRFLVNYHGGFKAFYHQTSENLIVTKLTGAYLRAAGRWTWGLGLGMHDTDLDVHDRDYRILEAKVFCRAKLLSWLDAEAYVGGRHFLFKPDDYDVYSQAYSHAGPLAGLRVFFKETGGMSAILHYQADARFYDHPALMIHGGYQVSDMDHDRVDIRHVIGIRLRRRFSIWRKPALIAEASYALLYNDTNSFGSSAHWHRIRLLLSAQLFHRITLHVMGTLQYTSYEDGVFIDSDLYDPEADENENSLVVRLSVPLWQGLGVFAHGALYRNEFSSRQSGFPHFSRGTVMLGLAYEIDF
jgi:hypothetical protein